MFIKQLSIFVENKAGRLAEITKIIGDAGIDMRALSIADTTSFGILRIIADQPELAEKVLKEAGLTVSITNVIGVGLQDKPGSFSSAMQALAQKNISIEYLYAYNASHINKAYLVMRVKNDQEAVEALKEAGFDILTGDEIYK